MPGQFGSPPGRFNSGVSTAAPETLFASLTRSMPTGTQYYHNDFTTYAAGDWTVTSTSTGSSALASGVGGLLLQSTAASTNDFQCNQQVTTSWIPQNGGGMWFWWGGQFSDANTSLVGFGLANSFATLAPTDGIYFLKASGSTTMTCKISASSTTTSINVGTVANATRYAFGFYYTGGPTKRLFVYSSIGMATPTAYGQPYYPGGVRVAAFSGETGATNPITNLPTAALTLGFGVKAGAAAIKTLTSDYIGAACEIPTRF